MATSSDEIFDKICTPCKDYHNNAEADFCCNQCAILMCKSCVRNHQKLFRRHEELGREDQSRWLTGHGDSGEELCSKHGEKVALRCVDHDQTCCSTCVLLEHRFCNTLAGLNQDSENVSTVASKSEPHIFSTKAFTSYKVKTNVSDRDEPYIYGCCQTKNGNIVIVDNGNKKLKELNSQYAIISSVSVQYEPQDVTCVGGNEVAVTVNDSSSYEIQFASANTGHMSLLRKFEVDHMSYGIACFKNELFVCSNVAVHVYSMTGTLLHTVWKDNSGTKQRLKVTMSNFGSKLFILCRESQELVTMDIHSKELNKLKMKDCKQLHGLCTVQDGSVIVCTNKAIIQVDSEGKQIMTTLAWDVHGVTSARSLCLNTNNNELIVGQGYPDHNIVVLKIA